MIPLTFLYDEYIDRPKLTEQKNPFEYIVPPPQVGSALILRLFHSLMPRRLWPCFKGPWDLI